MSFFSPNIEKKGRVVRGLLGLVLLTGSIAGWLTGLPLLPDAVLLSAALFTLYEAARGWCIARACGFKTSV